MTVISKFQTMERTGVDLKKHFKTLMGMVSTSEEMLDNGCTQSEVENTFKLVPKKRPRSINSLKILIKFVKDMSHHFPLKSSDVDSNILEVVGSVGSGRSGDFCMAAINTVIDAIQSWE